MVRHHRKNWAGRGVAADEDDRADDGTSSTKKLANGSRYQKAVPYF